MLCKCGATIPKSITIDGKRRNLRNRTQCLDCLPFGKSRYRKKNEAEIRSAAAEKSRRYYHRRKTELGVDPIRLLREKRKSYIVQLLGGGCQICGYSKTNRNLVYHHLRNKKFGICSRSLQYSPDRILEELNKCIQVCHNCHGEIHDGLILDSVVQDLNIEVRHKLEGFRDDFEVLK